MSRLRRRALLMTAAKIGTIRTEATATAVTAPATMHAETILTAIALVVTVLVRQVLLRLTAAGDECR